MLALAFFDQSDAALLFNPAASALSLHGFHVRTQSEEIVENAWRFSIEIVAGVRCG